MVRPITRRVQGKVLSPAASLRELKLPKSLVKPYPSSS